MTAGGKGREFTAEALGTQSIGGETLKAGRLGGGEDGKLEGWKAGMQEGWKVGMELW